MSPRIFIALAALCPQLAAADLTFQRDGDASFRFGGFVGAQIEACVTHWLLPAPVANPGMLEMFTVRDRHPTPNLVPWAGEFVGKYLISAIQVERLGHPELRPVIQSVLTRFIASQAEDGYLGPFRQEERLLKHWDLWGHYHGMLALLLWHEQTGDVEALACARRAADLVCDIYLDSRRRMIEAGSDEMNLSIIHVFGWLHRITGGERYLRMMREIEKDWERGGNFVAQALAGSEFFETPRPRWESLHSLQGILELFRITGEEKYRRAFEHWWRSIARWDIRNTGGFSSGEQATGNPYAPTPIETCCTIAWMALSTDMLALTGDSRVADRLELATFNAWAGAQHPSGRWCTYNTPMDGVREASAHSIVFQSRHGTPELNCCSVNGPRGWGMLADWALMKTADGLALNWLASGELRSSAPDGKAVRIKIEGEYPVNGRIDISVQTESKEEFPLRVRIPEWAGDATVRLNEQGALKPAPGTYWTPRVREGSKIALQLPLTLRSVPGAAEMRGKISVYRGPLLLAWDQRFNHRDENGIAPVSPLELAGGVLSKAPESPFPPLVHLQVNSELNLVDFASAGASGTRYVSWLPTANSVPAPVVTRFPRDSAVVPPGQTLFRWMRPPAGATYALEISRDEEFSSRVFEQRVANSALLLDVSEFAAAGDVLFWRVIGRNDFGTSVPNGPVARFRFDPTLPARNESLATARTPGPDGELARAEMTESPAPEFGQWIESDGWRRAENGEGIRLNGVDQRLIYTVGEWPEESYAVTVRFRLEALPVGRIGQVFSAWHAPMDDPLRLTISDGRLFARMEAGGAYSTAGVRVEPGRWYAVAAVREGATLVLYVDGEERGRASVPAFTSTRARDFALGGNPHYAGDEFVDMTVAGLTFYERALTRDEATATTRKSR